MTVVLTDEEAMLSVHELRKAYAGVVAVDDVSVQIPAGSIVGLVGKNGAGKSTLIKMLAGAITPDAGEIVLNGEPVQFDNPHKARSHGIAVMYQELEDIPFVSVAENVMLGSRFPRRGGIFVDWRATYHLAHDWLRELEVGVDPRAAIQTLSVAQRRLVMIARALNQQASLLILDEPSASLTGVEIERLFAACRRHRDRGGAVVYVSHRLEEIFALCDQVIVMCDGRVVLTDRTEALERKQVVSAITGRGSIATARERRAARQIGGRPESPRLFEVQHLEHVVTHGTRRLAIRDISFDLNEGEILGIAGLVGSGRTEVARMIFGADVRTSGEILVRGKPVDVRSPRDGMRSGIAYLPEDRRHDGLLLDFSIRENISLSALRAFRVGRLPFPSRRREGQAARDMIASLQIHARDEEQTVRVLSGGTQQKVVVGKWLLRNAEIMIFDEPTAGIDVEAKEQIYQLMETVAAQGKGVIFISSEFTELVAVCHRAIILSSGTIVGEVEGGAITEAALIELCYNDTRRDASVGGSTTASGASLGPDGDPQSTMGSQTAHADG